ncbi:MAG: hypothetical protein HYZ26_11480 [Chloroflexi bacterium]|nr:hypothetical protein [Chloroflexota bacterium]
MISTVVTTSTVSIAVASAITGSLAVIGVLVLLSLLVQKEIFFSSGSKHSQRLSEVINIVLPPMLIAFVVIVLAKVLQAIQ